MRNWLLWLIGRKEMTELYRWRLQWQEYRRWLAEFEDIGIALDCMKEEVDGTNAYFISNVRERIRMFESNRKARP